MRDTPLISTARTTLRELTTGDAAFVCRLLNEPTFVHYIGDRGVRNTADAAAFIETRYRQSYREFGYGLYLVESRGDGVPIGLCGLVRRDGLDHADLGFAFVPEVEGRGIAFEAAAATLAFGRETLDLTTVLAVVQPDNARSLRLLARLGFRPHGAVTLPGATVALDLCRWDAPSADTATTATPA